MIRTWTVPATGIFEELKFEIREPPLTGDNLGLKTWGTAFAIVKKLRSFGYDYFRYLIDPAYPAPAVLPTHSTLPISQLPTAKVLELGSGTGLVGIAAASIWRIDVLLTDLPEIQENLLSNVKRNNYVGRKLRCDVLDWRDPNGMQKYKSTRFEVSSQDPNYFLPSLTSLLDHHSHGSALRRRTSPTRRRQHQEIPQARPGISNTRRGPNARRPHQIHGRRIQRIDETASIRTDPPRRRDLPR